MTDGIMLQISDDGKATLYESTYDITIHCESEKEQREVIERLNSMNWIPVSERLPEDDEIVLVSDGADYAVAFWRSDAETWEDPLHGRLDSFEFTVKAWMPLPEPFKEGEQNV